MRLSVQPLRRQKSSYSISRNRDYQGFIHKLLSQMMLYFLRPPLPDYISTFTFFQTDWTDSGLMCNFPAHVSSSSEFGQFLWAVIDIFIFCLHFKHPEASSITSAADVTPDGRVRCSQIDFKAIRNPILGPHFVFTFGSSFSLQM